MGGHIEELVISQSQLAQEADKFANEFCRNNDSETEQILAGMTAVINGNESALEKMKNQKWFERIWFTLTGKNKATVAEMKQKRDLLTRYTVMLMKKILEMISGNSRMIAELYRSLSIVYRENNRIAKDINELTGIAERLNEKINSVDTYQNLITDIQNGKYNSTTPLLSLIDLMSSIDERTARDSGKISRIRETMEHNGFDFSKSVNVLELSRQVFALPEGKVGRIYLFCQELAYHNMILAYIGSFIENYFYLSLTDREIVRANGSAVKSELICTGLSESTKSNLGNMFMDIKNDLPDKALDSIVNNNVGQTETHRYNTSGVRVAIIGKDGADMNSLRDTLVNDHKINVKIEYSLEVGASNSKEMISRIQKKIAESNANCLVYCVSSFGGRFEKAESDIINFFREKSGLNVVIALTRCISCSDSKKMADEIKRLTSTEPVRLLVNDAVTDAGQVTAFGILDLIERITK